MISPRAGENASIFTRALLAFVSRGRLSEWAVSLILLGWAITLAFPGDTLLIGASYEAWRAIGGEEIVLATALAFFSGARLLVLWVNGRFSGSVPLRVAFAAGGAGFFSAAAVLFAMPLIDGAMSAPSLGVPTCAALAVTEMLSAWRAVTDVRLRPPH